MNEIQNEFTKLLRKRREEAGLTQRELARRVNLDASYINRMETGDRQPSRETALKLADALNIDDDALGKWLVAAGYAPMPLLTGVRGAVRSRGAVRTRGAMLRSVAEKDLPSKSAKTLWTKLEDMGLQEAKLGRLLHAMETAKFMDREKVAEIISTTFTRVAEVVESPVRTAIIPAAGGQHRLIAAHVMQRMLLHVIGETIDSGISNIILVLAPGSIDSLFTPISEALNLAVVPAVSLHYSIQNNPEGLGDAILQAEKLVKKEPFAVLLPDVVFQKRVGKIEYPSVLQQMLFSFRRWRDANIIAVKHVPKSKFSAFGVAKLDLEELTPDIFSVELLVEKPETSHPICKSETAFGIAGRYLLQPDIFAVLNDLKNKGIRPVHLTDALEQLNQRSRQVYAFDVKTERQDIGEVIGQAGEMIGSSS
jgi:UTP--glucose-1-phosphate uridylyltransferase